MCNNAGPEKRVCFEENLLFFPSFLTNRPSRMFIFNLIKSHNLGLPIPHVYSIILDSSYICAYHFLTGAGKIVCTKNKAKMYLPHNRD